MHTYTYAYQVICVRDLNEGYKAWKLWLKNEDVPRDVRRGALKLQDEKNWTPLHYASKFYRPDMLDIARDLESGEGTGMHTSLYVRLYNIHIDICALHVFVYT